MSVRNILERLGEKPIIDVPYYAMMPFTFTGAYDIPTTVYFARSNDLALIGIDGFTAPTITNQSEFISNTSYFPEQMKPNVTPLPSVVSITNGTNNIGCIYLDSQNRIHISGGPGLGTPFTQGATDAGIPYGAILSYSAN